MARFLGRSDLTLDLALWGKSPKLKDSRNREAAETPLQGLFGRKGKGIRKNAGHDLTLDRGK
jgi:hypothetical protein